MIKRLVIVSISIVASLCICQVNCVIVDQIVAIVNGEPITESMLEDALNALWLEASELPSSPTDALQNLIDKKLMLQEARLMGVFVTEEERSSRLSAIVSKFPSLEDFLKTLSENGISQSDLDQYIEEQIIIEKMIERSFGIFIKSSDIEGDAIIYFEQNKHKFATPELLRLKYLSVKTDDKSFAQSLINAIRSGRDVSKEVDERIVIAEPKQLSPEVAEAIRDIEVGDISPLFKTADGYSAIQLIERVPSRQLTFSEKRDEIIDLVTQQKIKEELQSWLKIRRNQSDIRINIKGL